MLCRAADLQFLVFPGLVDLDNMRLALVFFLIFRKNLHNVFFLVVSKHQVYRLILFQLALIGLHVASGGYHYGIRVHLLRFVEHLAGFTVCNIGYRTGIDHINISTWLKGNDLVSRLFQKLLHGLYLISIYLASKIV